MTEALSLQGLVIIYGPPGIGKSTIGKLLANEYPVIETDAYRGPAPEYEIYTDQLIGVLKGNEIILNSCPILDLVRVADIHLTASDDTLVERLTSRTNNEFGKTDADQKLALGCSRSLNKHKYNHTINTDNKTAEEVTSEIFNILDEYQE
jgi:shikimate kinase